MEELKPCPFCGGEAKQEHKDYILCTVCGCEGPWDERPAKEAWNTRNSVMVSEETSEYSVADHVTDMILHHIDTMYPEMWEAAPKIARKSIRNFTLRYMRMALSQQEQSNGL